MPIFQVPVTVQVVAPSASDASEMVLSFMEYAQDVGNDDGAVQGCFVGTESAVEQVGEKVFQVAAADIEHVLRSYSLRVFNTQGKSFEAMAAELVDSIDQNRIAIALKKAETPKQAVFDEIKNILVETGVLEF